MYCIISYYIGALLKQQKYNKLGSLADLYRV